MKIQPSLPILSHEIIPGCTSGFERGLSLCSPGDRAGLSPGHSLGSFPPALLPLALGKARREATGDFWGDFGAWLQSWEKGRSGVVTMEGTG